MGIPVLLVSTATRWFGTARMPRAFAHAGFDVALSDVRERLISIGMVPETGTPRELATNIRTEVARWGPIVKAAGIAPQ